MAGAALTALATGCNEDKEGITPDEEMVMGDVTFSVNASLSTKVSDDSFDDQIASLQIAVYDNDAKTMLASDKVTNASSMTLRLPCGRQGNYLVLAAVNSDYDLVSEGHPNTACGRTSSITTSSASAIEMAGMSSQINFVENRPYSIQVRRLTGKVSIGSITPNFSPFSYYHDKEFKLVAIYLTNVNPEVNIQNVQQSNDARATADPSQWLNQRGYASSSSDDLLYEDFSSISLANGTTHAVDCYFYPFPNSTTTDNTSMDGAFTARYTRLVIETILDGTTYYYPINIIGDDSKLQANTHYTIGNVSITGPGALTPEGPLDKSNVGFTIDVQPWVDGGNITPDDF